MTRVKPSRQRRLGGIRALLRRRWRLAARIAAVAAVLAGAGVYGYETGLVLAQQEARRAAKRMNDLSRTVQELERYNAVLARAADQAKLNESAWRRRYEALLARGRMDPLDGASPGDAGSADGVVLATAGPGVPIPVCDSEPRVETFRVRTPVGDGAHESAGFDGNRIIVSASGISAMSRNSEPLAWFDPAQPVALSFRTRDGRVEAAAGILPVDHRMFVDGVEYRFAASPAGRGQVEIAGIPCRPGGIPPSE